MGRWVEIRQADGKAGYANLDHAAMILTMDDGDAEIVWARPVIQRPDGALITSTKAAGSTPMELLKGSGSVRPQMPIELGDPYVRVVIPDGDGPE